MGIKTKQKTEKTAAKLGKPVVVAVPEITEDFLAEDGEGPSTPAAVAASTEAKPKDPSNVRITKALQGSVDRMARVSATFGHWDKREDSEESPNLSKMLSEASSWLVGALSFAQGLPADFAAPRKPRSSGTGPRAVLTVAKGDIVSVKPAALKNYLEADEKDLPGGNRITIVAFIGDKKVKARFGDDTMYIVSRSHLCELIK